MSKRGKLLLLVWTAPSVVFLAVTAIVYAAYRIPAPERLDSGERARVIAPLRAALGDHDPPPCDVHRGPGLVSVTVWYSGRPVIRIDGQGADLAGAVDNAATQLRARPQIKTFMARGDMNDARIQVDVISG